LYSNPPSTISTTSTVVLSENSFTVDQATITVAAATVTTGPVTVTVMTATVTFFSYAQEISVSTTSRGVATITETMTLPATPCAMSSTPVVVRRLERPPVHKSKQPWHAKQTEAPNPRLVERDPDTGAMWRIPRV
jgi:hypothetical protein